MEYFAGIDGGQSSTEAIVADESGTILGRGNAGPADEIGQDRSSTRLRDALADALADAVRNAKLPADTRFTQIVAGLSGYEGRVYGAAPALPADGLQLVHDSAIAHAGALEGDPGIVVIAGTGSVALAKNGGRSAMVGGWGYVFGDEGSAFWLAREAVSQAMRTADNGEADDFAQLALMHFAQPSLRALSRAFYAGEITRADLARFGADILLAAQRGNGAAAALVRDGAHALVLLGMHAMWRTGLPADSKIAFTGGVMRSETVRAQLAQAVHGMMPRARLVSAKHDGATGALILALAAAGRAPRIA